MLSRCCSSLSRTFSARMIALQLLGKKAIAYAIGLALVSATASPVSAQLYWDSNGTTAGAGATPTGTWGTSTFWSTASDGTATTTSWTFNAAAVFSAGTD